MVCARSTNATNRGPVFASAISLFFAMLLFLSGIPSVGFAQNATPHANASGSETRIPALHYSVEARFEPDVRSIAGSLMLDWTNHTGEAQTVLPFRLYPNAPTYYDGGMEVSNVVVQNQPAEFRLHDDPTVFSVNVAEAIQPDDRVEVAFDFTTTIPTDTDMAANVLFGDSDSGWLLADWLPVLAGWEPSSGWYLAPPDRFGNPTLSDTSMWDLALTLPAELTVVGGGSEIWATPQENGLSLVEITTPPARDLTLVLIPESESPTVVEQQVGNITVRTVLPEAWSGPDLTSLLLETAADVLPLYEAWLGPHPSSELILTNVASSSFHAVAWNGSIWLNLIDLAPDAGGKGAQTYLRFVLAHELAHLWFNHTVGSNNNTHGFLSESLASHLAVLALAHDNEDLAAEVLSEEIAAPYLRLLDSGADGVVDLDGQRVGEMADAYALLYGKGTLGFEAIRQAIGHEAYMQALRSYASSFWFEISTPNDLLAALSAVSDGATGPVWQKWFREATTSRSEVEDVVRAFRTMHDGMRFVVV